jgi:pyridoxine kinase
MNILSIQSWVAYGHVGNAAAVFPLQRLGAEVWAVNTVQFSNHPGYPSWTGHVFTGQQIAEVVDGIAARGVLEACDGMLSGYLGDGGVAEAVVSAAERVKAANPAALYCCDPVIGDVGKGVYVRAGLPELIRDRALPRADIVTPNQFELEYLSGIACGTRAGAKAAAAALQAGGPRTVLVTSLRTDETPDEAVDMLVGRCSRPRSMAPATRSPHCSCCTGCARAARWRRWRRPARPSSACCDGRRRPGRGNCCWSRHRTNSSIRARVLGLWRSDGSATFALIVPHGFAMSWSAQSERREDGAAECGS